MQLVTPINIINSSLSNILAKGLNKYVDLKIIALIYFIGLEQISLDNMFYTQSDS